MGAIWRWLKTFNLFREYLRAAGGHWQEILGGVSVPFLIWGVWFIVGNPPAWVNWSAVLFALLIAGYFVWRADHVRLIAGIKVAGARVHYQLIADPHSILPPGFQGHNSFVQLLIRCTGEAPMYECAAYLLRIREWLVDKNKWLDIPLSGPISLRFNSIWGSTQHPGAEEPLDVIVIEHKTTRILTCSPVSVDENLGSCSSGQRALRFDIRITCSERVNGVLSSIKPVDACLDVQFGNDPYTPVLELIEDQDATVGQNTGSIPSSHIS